MVETRILAPEAGCLTANPELMLDASTSQEVWRLIANGGVADVDIAESVRLTGPD